MPRRKRSLSPCDIYDDDLDDDSNSQSSRNGNPPIQRNAANARERARMRVLSSAFGRLKTKLPNIPPDTKLSKLDTLRLATMYIKQLRALAEGSSSSNEDTFNQTQFTDHSNVIGMQNAAHNMTWPFGLHHIQHPTNRQIPFHCSTMEWNPSHETAANTSKGTQLENDAHFQSTQHVQQQIHPWYTAEDTNCITQRNCHNNFDAFSGFNQVPPTHTHSQHISSALSSTSSHPHPHQHHYHQSTMSPIR